MEIGPSLALGRTADVRPFGDGRVIKLFFPGWPVESVEREAVACRAVQGAGLPAPRLLEVVEADGRVGLVFERVDGVPVLDLLLTRPWTVWWWAGRLAALHGQIHRAPGLTLPSLKERLESRIGEAPLPSERLRAAALATLTELPDGDRILHGDFHPGNVIDASGRLVSIDWMDAARGEPAADVARTSLLLSVGQPAGLPIHSRLALGSMRRLFRRAYLRQYGRLTGVGPRLIEAWRLPVAAARLAEGIPGEETVLADMVARAAGRRPR